MKVLKFFSVPVLLAGVLSLATVTASANHATISATLNCNSTTAGKVCFDLTISTAEFGGVARDLTVTLLGHKKGAAANAFTQIGTPQTQSLADKLDNKVFTICFPDVTTSDFDSFELKLAGNGFDINGSQYPVTLKPVQNSCMTSPTPTPTPSTPASPTPTPSGSGSGSGSPTPTPTAAVAALAQTGGFDFRYPLIGLVLLVAGGALYLVSASRGRSANSK